MLPPMANLQLTLTPPAAEIFTAAAAEAARRGHAKITPLHIAATLIATPSSLLLQACHRSCSASYQPLHSRALELCFSVALDRLPASSNTASVPPISNALSAALKRAQAAHRRGCPEIQQQPLLAIKVDLEQLVVSILDDPNISRVMREAGFSSTTVKTIIMRSLPSPVAAANFYMNPLLNGSSDGGAQRVLEIITRPQKPNPVMGAGQFEKEPSKLKTEATKTLPHWMQPTKPPVEQASVTQELLNWWRNNSSRLHPNRHIGVPVNPSERALSSQPAVPVKNDLALGHRMPVMDSFKDLLKGLSEKVAWQPEAAAAVATVVSRCKVGNCKPGSRADTWMLFAGPDSVGKRMMAAAISELIFGAAPLTVKLDGVNEASFRGKTVIDLVTEAIRRNSFSVVLMEGVDRSDIIVSGSIKRAIESGRLVDSQGREVSLGGAIFVLNTSTHCSVEDTILNSANCGWQLELKFIETMRKHVADECLYGEGRPSKLRKQLSLDLNLAAREDDEDDTGDEGSRNSSSMPVELGQTRGRLAITCGNTSPTTYLRALVDGVIDFKPVDFSPIKRKVMDCLSTKFRRVMGNGGLLWFEEDAIDRIVGSVFLAGAADTFGIRQWSERVFVSTLRKLKNDLKVSNGNIVVRLSAVTTDVWQSCTASNGLPETVSIAIDRPVV